MAIRAGWPRAGDLLGPPSPFLTWLLHACPIPSVGRDAGPTARRESSRVSIGPRPRLRDGTGHPAGALFGAFLLGFEAGVFLYNAI